jgi:hypothetical protein
MKCGLDADFVLQAKERAAARAAALHNTLQSKKVSERGRALMESHLRANSMRKKAYA